MYQFTYTGLFITFTYTKKRTKTATRVSWSFDFTKRVKKTFDVAATTSTKKQFGKIKKIA